MANDFVPMTKRYRTPEGVEIVMEQDVYGDVEIFFVRSNGQTCNYLTPKQDPELLTKLGFPTVPPQDVTIDGGIIVEVKE